VPMGLNFTEELHGVKYPECPGLFLRVEPSRVSYQRLNEPTAALGAKACDIHYQALRFPPAELE
jgi:hypothetical protein